MNHFGPLRRRRARFCLLATALAWAVLAAAAGPLRGAEIHSNGFGGGDWSDPGSWREKAVPAAADDVVVSRGDAIAFDQFHEGKPSCKHLYIDPQGTFAFKSGAGQLVCSVAGTIESYGALKIDASHSASDHFELRLTGDTAEARTVKLLKGASLVLNGKRNLAHGKHNVVITSRSGKISAGATAVLDVHDVELVNIHVDAANIDNTGAKVNERLNLNGSHFAGQSHVSLSGCDSPTLSDNFFELTGAALHEAAMSLNSCPLAEIRDTEVKGHYAYGILTRLQADSTVTNCAIEGCDTGIHWNGADAMIKGVKVNHCSYGINAESSSGELSDVHITNCKTAFGNNNSKMQLTNVSITEVPHGGARVVFAKGALTLLNCNISREEIAIEAKGARVRKHVHPLVECLYYLVVEPKGNVPQGAMVYVHTTAAAASPGVDPNVRNSPAVILRGTTPLPQSKVPLMVRAWSIDPRGKLVPAPLYTINVVLPSGQEGKPARQLGSVSVRPDKLWYRAEPDAAKSTLEVPVK